MAKVRLNLSHIRKRYRLNSSNMDERLLTICDKVPTDMVYGMLSVEGTKIYFHGIPGSTPKRVTTMEELDKYILDFQRDCEHQWIDPRGLSPMYNKMARVSYVLPYIANRLGFQPVRQEFGYDGSSFYVGSKYLNCDMLKVGMHRCDFNGASFIVTYRDNSYTESPVFDDYISAMEWLKSVLVPIMFLIGSDILAQAAQLETEKSSIGDSVVAKLNLRNPKLFDVKPLREVLVELLEKQLKKIKEEK